VEVDYYLLGGTDTQKLRKLYDYIRRVNMRLAGMIKNSVVNGTGIRDVVFLQGCPHQCIGCHNAHTWNASGGYWKTIPELMEELADSNNDITISGGEPLTQYSELLTFMEMVSKTQNKRFWLYTGYHYEDLLPSALEELAKYVDVLVDGPFEIDKKDLRLQFRGSSNQRLIDLPKSVANNKIILWEGI
jgi:anaerobic ribonucleoside-triphosphate reductase activating protein